MTTSDLTETTGAIQVGDNFHIFAFMVTLGFIIAIALAIVGFGEPSWLGFS